jgi:outer membrane protein OmpA-like peptidoglycan-associated protein
VQERPEPENGPRSGTPGAGPGPVAAEPPSPQGAEVERFPEPPIAPDAPAGEMEARDQRGHDQQAGLAAGPTRPDDPNAPVVPVAIASLVFAPDSAALNGDAEGALKDLAARFPIKDEAMRLQLMAYAGGEDMSASKARRLSLDRALAVRSYLMANGIDGTRMDVRALGNSILDSALGAPTDRVDIAMIRR